MKRFQEAETRPVAFDIALTITMTWMTENFHQQLNAKYCLQGNNLRSKGAEVLGRLLARNKTLRR